MVALAAAKRGSTTGAIAVKDAAAQELAERRKLARAAAAWAFENKVGSKAALKDEQFKDRGLTYNMVEPLLKEMKAGGTKKRVDAPRDHHCQVLTNGERIKLADWILACAAGQDPKGRTAVSAKFKAMLRARHASNKRRKWQGCCIRLNYQEVAVVQSREPSHLLPRLTQALGARRAGPRRACARSGHVLQRAGRSCWATTPLWARKTAHKAGTVGRVFLHFGGLCVTDGAGSHALCGALGRCWA